MSEETQEKLVERLTSRIEELNTYILKEIGEQINRIGHMNPTRARQAEQLLKYNESLDKIVKEISRVTNLNTNEIYEILEEEARTNVNFAKVYYRAKNIPFVPYEQNTLLQSQIREIAQATAYRYFNLSNTMAFATRNVDGELIYTNLAQTYQNTIDKAILSVMQGKETYYQAMRQTMLDLSEGMQTVDYASGYTRRLDSATSMNIRDGIRQAYNASEETLAEQLGLDGIEISVHAYPAPDHEDIQGRQFTKEEFNKLQSHEIAKDYKGNVYYPEYNTFTSAYERRAISTLNCQHTIKTVLLGVKKPDYSDEELQAIIDRNRDGFEIDGKHYTMYQGTQMQRRIETEIRKSRDTLTIAEASGDEYLINKSRARIRTLNKKYKDLSKISNLPTKLERTRIVKK